MESHATKPWVRNARDPEYGVPIPNQMGEPLGNTTDRYHPPYLVWWALCVMLGADRPPRRVGLFSPVT